MNSLDAVVTEVLSVPKKKSDNVWVVKVRAVCYGSEIISELFFVSEEKANEVGVGFVFET
jgi:hypothetical protein